MGILLHIFDPQSKRHADTLMFSGKVLPPNSTTIEPLEKKEGFSVCFIDGKWEYIKNPPVFYHQIVKSKRDINKIMSNMIPMLGEEKAKTEKLLAGNEPCLIWDNFITKRNKILEEGRKFIQDNNLE